MTCNAKVLEQARANVAANQHPAHTPDILAGKWDGPDGCKVSLVQAEVLRLLKKLAEDGEE